MEKDNIILDASDMNRTLKRITHEILEVHKGIENLTLIGIQTRGVYLAKRIQSRINEIEEILIKLVIDNLWDIIAGDIYFYS